MCRERNKKGDKKEASKMDNIMKVQKMTITKNVTKCLKLLDQFKFEQKHVNSPLIKQAASEFETAHKKLIEQLAGLDQNMQKYMILSVQAVTELGEGVLEQKILEQTAQMEKYSHMVESIKENNLEVFREIYFLLDSHETKQPIRQLPAKQTSAKFKPDLELRPAPLVFNCTIVEMHRFND